MSERLPAPWGSRIKRDRQVQFTFEGQAFSAYEGDTIASALAACRQKILSRSFKYHRPRGILTMAGQDANTLVQLAREPNVRADLRPVEQGMTVTAQNVFGSLVRDWGSVLDKFGRFMPVGFYYRTFYGPTAKSWLNVWEPLIRRAAGLGTISFDPPATRYRKATRHCDVFVVGAGPAGLSAALAAADAGAEVLVVDQNPDIGGSLNYARFDVSGMLASETLAELVNAVSKQPRIRVLANATCNGWYADNWLPVLQGDTLYRVRAREVILATGSQEQPLVFRNNDLPGIMLSSAAQRLMRCYGVRPGTSAIVFAGGIDGLKVAMDLLDAGISIAGIIEPPSRSLDGNPYRIALQRRNVTFLPGCEIRQAHGRKSVNAITVSSTDGNRTIPCDLVVISTGYTPGYQLALHAGGKLRYFERSEQFAIDGLPDGVRMAGSAANVVDLPAVMRDGAIAGGAAAGALGFAVADLEALEDPEAGLVNFRSRLRPDPNGRDFVDFDEDLQVKDIVNAVKDGYRELELVKRFSTVGMGPSQGRHSALSTARIVAEATNRSVEEVGITTSRPPFGPERLGLLAGPGHRHFRNTAIHDELVRMGARMVPIGAWWRPAYFGPSERMQEVVREEVHLVRNAVGVLDVSTLGKLAIRGRDAGAFLDRVYTMMHSNQAIGKVRYCLMLNEMGSVIDDGVAFRASEDYYHVTTTTGTAARIYAEMCWLNAQWGMQVDIQNITGGFSGLNVTGPLARSVLSDLDGDIDFSSDAFKFLEGRSGQLAGCPVLAMRIGFTGELSYEIHLPYSKTRQFWQALLKAGEKYGLKPYGLEASRILRLEKGHIVIGQDTDALTTPDELSMEWALSKKKPFFIGRTALMHRRKSPASRKLCGFTVEKSLASQVTESCLVYKNGKPVGFVSSYAYSPTVDAWIGLAYAHPDDAAPGRSLEIKSLGGEIITVKAVSPHFFDPENTRQTI